MLGVLCGCAERLSAQQREWLNQGQDCYERGDWVRAIDYLSRFLAEVREGPAATRALYLRGASNAEAGRRSQAYVDLLNCVRGAPHPEAVWRAYVALGTLHFEERKWDYAAQDYRAAAERMPGGPPKDYVLVRRAICLERAGQWVAARDCWGQIVREFPAGRYGELAARRLSLGADHFAVQCGAFRDRANADRLCRELMDKGLEASVQTEAQKRTPLYVVVVGRYADFDEAERHLAMIKERYVKDAVLWP